MSKVYRQTVIYSEREMRRKMLAPSSSTVAEARAAAVKDMTDHLRSWPGVSPATITLDEACVEMYLLVDVTDGMTVGDIGATFCQPEPNTIIGDLGDIVMLLQSKMEPGSTTRPGPIIDAHCNATAELAEVRELLGALHRLSTVDYGGVYLDHGAAATEETLEAIPVEESSTSID
ncbi:hypothetical protein BD779DRAFT_1678383 [Infundibulicybe gibba]|nr:hypothetical protein BD779DRAFT_1678383 [Infundibulicybe gibba]